MSARESATIEQIEDIYPLSPLQEGMLFHSLYQRDKESDIYMGELLCSLHGRIDFGAFSRAWQQIIDRHSILRTAFVWEGLDEPLQVVCREARLPLEYNDWRRLSKAQQASRLDACIENYRRQRFDFTQPPMMRLALFRVAETDYRFFWCHHHMLLDGWSCSILLKELFLIYEAYSQGRDIQLEPTRPFRNYIAWLQQQDADAAKSFWREMLQGVSSSTPLITDPASDKLASQPEAYDVQSHLLAVATTQALRSLARQHQVTPNTLVQAAWALLLNQYSGEPDVVFGATVSGRPTDLPGIESIVGMLINTLPVRAHINPTDSLVALFRTMQAQQFEAQQYQYSSLVKIQSNSDIPVGGQLFESIVVFENQPLDAYLIEQSDESAALRVGNVRTLQKTNYPLNLIVDPGQRLSLQIIYDCRRFSSNTVARMIGHLQNLLEAFVINPQCQIAQVSVLSPTERRQLLVDWNDTQSPYSDRSCLPDLFEAQVEKTPDSIAVVFEGNALTYREVEQCANRLANHLQALGVGPEKLVTIFLDRSADMLIGLLAVLKAGGAYVPLDPAYPKDRLAFVLENTQSPVILTQERLLTSLPEHQAHVVCLDRDARIINRCGASKPASQAAPENLAYVIYTSGSTGKPKGVQITHRAVVNFLESMKQQPGMTAQETLAAVTTLSFDIAALEMFLPIITGATVVILPREVAADAVKLSEQMTHSGATTLQATPATWRMLVESGWQGSPHLKALCGGEGLPVDLAAQIHCRVGSLWNMYGPTETTIWSSLQAIEASASSISIGRPIANTQMYVLDERLGPVAIGVPGELLIGGDGLSRGYFNRPELTAEKFVPDPFSKEPGARLYRTGDVAHYAEDGNLHTTGRVDHQVKIRGFRIEPGEITALLNRHDKVREAIVVAREDSPGDKRLVAYLVPIDAAEVTTNELRNYLKATLPDYMVPSGFVMLGQLPLTPNGKIDRAALPVPEQDQSDLIMPRNPIEEMVAEIFAEVLKLERAGISDDFFALGGHSLSALQAVGRINEAFRINLQVRDLFDEPTVSGLVVKVEAALLASMNLSQAPNILRANRDEQLPLSYAQQRLWFIEQLQPGNSLFNIVAAVRLQGRLNLAALEHGLNRMVARHEALRTRFVVLDGQPLQQIDGERVLRIEFEDLSREGEERQEALVKERVEREAQRPFSLSEGPLLRMKVIGLSEESHVGVVSLHHIISDGWSMGLVIGELASGYEGYERGAEEAEEELSIQYGDYAKWQRDWLKGEVLERELKYWRGQLASAPPLLNLPTDRPRPQVQTFNGAGYDINIPVETTGALKALARQESASLFMVLMAAFDVLLHYYTNTDDIIVGTDIAGRPTKETEALIGLFVNQLPIRARLASDARFSDLLRQVRDTTLEAYAHQNAPVEKIMEALKLERNLKHAPLFQVKLVLQNTPMPSLSLPGLSLDLMDIDSRGAKLDLTLLLGEDDAGLSGVFEYNTDLFDATTVARISHHFQIILRHIIARPEASLSELVETLTGGERKQKQKQREAMKFNKFKDIKPKEVALDTTRLVKTQLLSPEMTLPLVITPNLKEMDLTGWARDNREYLENELTKHGALLFRDFSIESPADFEQFALTLCPDLLIENGEHPRQSVSGNVYTPVFYPPDQKLLWHNENSFNHKWPTKIFFCCMQPAREGGETTLVDSRRVMDLIDPALKEEFIAKNVMYVRNYSDELGLNWQTVFQTSNASDVERRCKENFMEFEWRAGDHLKTRCIRPAAVRHPRTGELTWFNQAQHWHISCLDAETRQSLLSLYQPEELPRHCFYGDGSPIDASAMANILDAYSKLEARFPWQRGDILLVDNLLAAHARNPFVGERKLLVAMGGVTTYDTVAHR